MLKNTIENSYKRNNIRYGFNALKQDTQPFTTFYSEFCRYINYFNTSEQDMIDKLKDRVNLFIKKAVSILVTSFTTIEALNVILMKVNNHNHQLYKEIAAQEAEQTTTVSIRQSVAVFISFLKKIHYEACRFSSNYLFSSTLTKYLSHNQDC